VPDDATAHDQVRALAQRLCAAGDTDAGDAPEPVSLPLIRQWCEAIGDRNSIYTEACDATRSAHGGVVAPPAMIQVWTMPGLARHSTRGGDPPGSPRAVLAPGGDPPGSPRAVLAPGSPRRLGGTPADEMFSLLRASGYTGVVATNCEQTYDRYLRPGELLRATTRMGAVTGPKRTGLGEGYFVTWHTTWFSGQERVGQMMFRVLQFRPPVAEASGPAAPTAGRPSTVPAQPAQSGDRAGSNLPDPRFEPVRSEAAQRVPGQPDPAAPGAEAAPDRYPLRPAINADTRFFWAGADAGELRIQRCGSCGVLRHPPGPMCPRCHGTSHDYVVASGRGEVFSYVVHHHPPVPGRTAPFVVAVVQLPEGVRIAGNVLGVPPEQVQIGMPVEVVFERADAGLVLPQWRPASDGTDVLPELVVPLTTTTVVTTAIATRDFTALHHDRAAARAQGMPDVFLNILTTMGLTQRLVTDWAGPRALVRAIAVRLGAPACAGDTLNLTGMVAARDGGGSVTVDVRGACSLGDHVTGTVRLEFAEEQR
jgi:uncharacterized OB-fold protein